jgi:hypothetical protein
MVSKQCYRDGSDGGGDDHSIRFPVPSSPFLVAFTSYHLVTYFSFPIFGAMCVCVCVCVYRMDSSDDGWVKVSTV